MRWSPVQHGSIGGPLFWARARLLTVHGFEGVMRRDIRTVSAAAVTLLAPIACGAVDQSTTRRPTTARARLGLRVRRAPHTSGASESPKSQRVGDDPCNLTAGDWPPDLRGPDALYDEMPTTFKTWPVTHVRSQPGTAGVFYRSSAEAFSMEANNEDMRIDRWTS